MLRNSCAIYLWDYGYIDWPSCAPSRSTKIVSSTAARASAPLGTTRLLTPLDTRKKESENVLRTRAVPTQGYSACRLRQRAGTHRDACREGRSGRHTSRSAWRCSVSARFEYSEEHSGDEGRRDHEEGGCHDPLKTRFPCRSAEVFQQNLLSLSKIYMIESNFG